MCERVSAGSNGPKAIFSNESPRVRGRTHTHTQQLTINKNSSSVLSTPPPKPEMATSPQHTHSHTRHVRAPIGDERVPAVGKCENGTEKLV